VLTRHLAFDPQTSVCRPRDSAAIAGVLHRQPAGEIVIARAAAFLRNGDEVRSIEVADAAREAAK